MPTTTARRGSPYGDVIRERLARIGYAGVFDPRHVEAYMRVEHPTLDNLSVSQFNAEIVVAIGCIQHGGTAAAELLAVSFGF